MKKGREFLIAGSLSGAALAAGIGALAAGAADCNPDLGDVCVPGLTVPPDVDPVPGNPKPGETIPVSPTMPEKGTTTTEGTTTTSSTTTTVPESSTTSTTSTVPEITTTTWTSIPTTTTIVVTVPQETIPGHTN